MKKQIALILIFLLLLGLNFLTALKFNFFIIDKPGLKEHYNFKQTIYINYPRGVKEHPPNINIIGKIYEYNKSISWENTSIFQWAYGGRHIEGYYYDQLFAYLRFLPYEKKSWVLTTVECEIIAEVMGAKMLYTCNIKLNTTFTKNYQIKPNYSSPFNQWCWIEASTGGYLGIPRRFRVDFVREDIDLGLENLSDVINRTNRIVVEVPKESCVGFWNFSIFVGLKDIEFKGSVGKDDSYIVLIASFIIRSYEKIFTIDYPLATLWSLNLILTVLIAAAAFKCEGKQKEKQ